MRGPTKRAWYQSSGTLRLPLEGGVRRARFWRARAIMVPAAVGAAALGCSLAPWSPVLRAIAALVAIATSIMAARRARRPAPGAASAWIVVDGRGVHRVERHRASMLADFAEPVGLAVLASVDRATLRLAFTTPRAARYVGAEVRDAVDAAAAHTLLERATTVADDDLRGGPGTLSASNAERLVEAVAARAPGALDRLYLSDATGEPVVLDRGELRVGLKRFDLTAPVDWRAFLFQELGAYAVSVCQATWVRQADVEVVLVASVSSEGAQVRETHAAVRAAGEGPLVRRSLARDVRLMQASAGEPPPRELRCAIDRAFMLPVRHALDRAPRASRASAPSSPRHPPADGAREKLG